MDEILPLTMMKDSIIVLQKKDLLTVYEDKVKDLVKKLLVLDGDSERCIFITLKKVATKCCE